VTLTALEWLRVTHANTLSGRRIEQAVADAEARGYERGRRDFQFQPEGDNHHNAALCPHCSPQKGTDRADDEEAT
jgi:hypothetical protein